MTYYFKFNHFPIIALCILFGTLLSAKQSEAQQLRPYSENEQFGSERPIYLDEKGDEYSDMVYLKFNQRILTQSKGTRNIPLQVFMEGEPLVRSLFQEYVDKYQLVEVKKVYPNKVWGDTRGRNRRTGEMVQLHEKSQVVTLHFGANVNVSAIVRDLSRHPLIEYVHGPARGILTQETPSSEFSFLQAFRANSTLLPTSPNDWAYVNGHQWNLEIVESEMAWDYSKGDGIEIAIHDQWNNSVTTPHVDLDSRFVSSGGKFGGHMGYVASIAGAETNNTDNLASLGWEVDSLRGYSWLSYPEIGDAVDEGSDIINFSWIYDDDGVCPGTLCAELQDALEQGVILTASAGNDSCADCEYYPAAFNYDDDGVLTQVIAVSASMANDDFRTGWNHSPGTNPISNPDESFIDIAAPGDSTAAGDDGVYVTWKSDVYPYETLVKRAGTSFAAPLVAAAAALLLEEDGSLTPPEVYQLLTQSADTVGQHIYGSDSWNQYMGYGRLNAGAAVCYLEGTCVPGAPLDLTLDNQGQTGQNPELSWRKGAGPVIEYEVWRKPILAPSGSYAKIATVSDLEYVDTDITIGTSSQYDDKYSYVVRAVGFGSTSSNSNEVITWGEVSYKNGLVSENTTASIPLEFELKSNYPNPFNPSTTLKFTLPETGNVSLVVRDITGKTVATLMNNQSVSAGFHEVKFDASDLPSGQYFYTITTPSKTATRSMMLIK